MQQAGFQKQVLLVMGKRYIDRVHRGVAEYAREKGWHLTNLFGYDAGLIRSRQCDGVIASLEPNDPLTEDVLSMRRPTVDLSIAREDSDLVHLTGDNRAMGRAAARHFMDRGFRNYVWFSEGNHTAAQLRREGYENELGKHGFACQSLVVTDRFSAEKPTWASLNQWLVENLREMPEPCAVYAYNDVQAADLLSVCAAGGIRVPDEVAVLGTDNHPLICPTAAIPLSSINHDLEALGRRAAEELDRMMTGVLVEARVIEVPHRGITIRQSSDVYAINDPHLVRALRFIQTHYSLNIGVRDVVAAVEISRRPLERRFQQHLQRSIHGQLNHLRLGSVCRLLRETSSSIAVIAAASGFSTPEYLHRVFLKHMQTTPRRYRLEHAEYHD